MIRKDVQGNRLWDMKEKTKRPGEIETFIMTGRAKVPKGGLLPFILHIISHQKCAYFDSGRNKRLMIWNLSRLLKHTVFLITKMKKAIISVQKKNVHTI